jgi:hypothetical protein
MVSWLRDADTASYDVLVNGRAAPGSGITSVELHSATGTEILPTQRGYFLASLPPTREPDALAADGTPYSIIGYGHRGVEIARVDLARLLELAQPPA